MSEVEKLRALLREARASLLRGGAHFAGEPLIRGIDAALGETPKPWVPWKTPPPVDSGNKCPRCGGRMVMRIRRTDAHAFYGCADYPRCTGTRDLDGTSNYHPDPHGNMDGTGDDIYDLDNGGWGAD